MCHLQKHYIYISGCPQMTRSEAITVLRLLGIVSSKTAVNPKRFNEFIAGPNLLITVNIQLVFPMPLRNTLEADELSICSL